MDAIAPPARRAALAFIFVTVLIDILSFGLIIPVLPQLLKQFMGGDISRATLWHGLFATAFMAMQFFSSPIQGALSDRFGRRPIILISNLGLAVDFLIMAIAQTLPLLFIGRLLSGVTSASFSTANAYVADVTPPDKRAAAFGKLGMAFGLGFTLAPVFGSFLGKIDVRFPFYVAAGLAFANFCYGYFVLPESLTPENRSPRFEWARANPVASLRLLRGHPELFGLASVVFLMAVAHMVYPTTFALYADYRFGWDQSRLEMVGYTLLLVGVLTIIVQGGLIGRIVKALGERRALMFGLMCGMLGFFFYGLAPTGYWFWAAMPIAALWGVANPAAQAIMTRHVTPQEQGRLQGAIGSMNSIAGIIAPTMFTQTLAAVAQAHVHTFWAGATFWLASAMLAIAALVAWRTTRGE
ncbi:TCR/Tet family MFS transporter [Arenimonas sp.]|uniref:TCR/Tet family MFS transporter n=1 Tax=Arenimonas sp. TaxID=1872635 RepID=UPI0039E66263